jgi:hypothetical protein
MAPCHHGLARPQFAVGGTASSTEGSCEYIESAVADSRQGVASPTPTPLSAPLGTTPYRICFTNIKNIYINDLNTLSFDFIPFAAVFFLLCHFSLLYLPSPDEVAPWPPRTASVLQEIGWPGTIFVLSGTEVCVFTCCK